MYPATHYQNGLCRAELTPQERKEYGIQPLKKPRKTVLIDNEGERIKPSSSKRPHPNKVRKEKQREQSRRAKRLREIKHIRTLSTDPERRRTA